MPCAHKFIDELELKGLDYAPETLVVGTFNPAWPEENTATWFYGRTQDELVWNVLPRLYGSPSLAAGSETDWKEFCKTHRIAFTDLITSIDDADEANKNHRKIISGFADKALVYNFDDFVFTDVVGILKRHPSIRNVYITRGITESFWRHLWSPIMHYCNTNGLHERRLLPASEESTYQHEAHNQHHPDGVIDALPDYILYRWKQEWHC